MIVKYIIFLSVFILVGCNDKKPNSNEKITIEVKTNKEYLEFRGLAFSKEESSYSTPKNVNGSIEFIVENGKQIKKGDLLVKIKSSRENNKEKKLKNRLFYAKRRLKSEKEKVAKERLKLELDVLEKEYAYTIKKMEINYKSGERDSRVLKSLDLKTKLIDEKLFNLTEKMKSYQILADENSIPLDEIEKMKKQLKNTKLNHSLQLLDKKEKLDGTIGKEKEQLLLELDLLKHNLKKSKLTLEEKEKLFPLNIEKRELVVKKRESGLKKIYETLKASSVMSKVDGVFVRVKHPWNGNYIEKGTDVWRGMTLGKVLDYENISVKFRLPEKYVDLVKVGMKLSFYSLQNSDKKIEAKVKKIDSIATPVDPMNRKSNKFHWLFIEMKPQSYKFLPSETFICKILLNSHKDSIFIPKELAIIKDKNLLIETSEGQQKITSFVKGLDYYILLNQKKSLDINYAL
ncbi:MAG: hypothetical protein COB02_11365 [Candidatus Cloacimonadota bacterium]|nr:MAG: hypothetical protein COB02_11365 [Candidatus Cloacimonadota bacterium]